MRNNTLNFIKSLFISFFLLPYIVFAESATSNEKIWTLIEKPSEIKAKGPTLKPWIELKSYRAFTFDVDAFLDYCALIEREKSNERKKASLQIDLPSPSGIFQRFLLIESPIMAPELAERYPEIKTYRGTGIDDPSATLRMDITPSGCHMQVRSELGNYYIDPLYSNNATLHACYQKKDLPAPGDLLQRGGSYISKAGFECHTPPSKKKKVQKRNRTAQRNSNGNNLYTFRLAVAGTGEYTAFHGGTVASGQAAIVTAINRVNGLYENDLSVRLILVANNDQLVYTNAGTDPYSNNDASAMLTENQSNIDLVIGSANYDIGHIFSTGGGGLAGFGVVCDNTQKAEGVTGNSSPTGDSFWVDYVAHEIGHQFKAEHTFNGVSGSCAGGNRSANTAYEPGSGSSIMAYAGICDGDNLQGNSDAFFHSSSLDEITNFIDTISCAQTAGSSNTIPTVNAGSDYTIPAQTPFILTATGGDADGDSVTYSWEERDLGVAQAVSAGDNGASPLFRVWPPTTDPSRTFPRLQDLLANNSSIGETLPTTNRNLNFRCVARDNRSGGGAFNSDDMTITVSAGAGPFRVTYPNASAIWNSSSQTITWDVANTTLSPVNATNVDIFLSTDGGNTFPYTLATNTPNDGTETVSIPAVTTTQAVVKIQGSNNIFFDISDQNSTINLSTDSIFTVDSSSYSVDEDAGTVLITVKRTNSTSGAVSVDYLATNGTASSGIDYTASSGILSFADGETSKSISISIIDDVLLEGNLTFFITLSNPSTGAQIGSPNTATITIVDNESPPSFCNTGIISIPTVAGSASPNPSTINVSGLTGTIQKVTIQLTNLTHTYAEDLDVLLVGPNGKQILLMSDVGGANVIAAETLVFDDAGPALSTTGIISGTYQPTNLEGIESLPAPAPTGTNEVSLAAAFGGIDPNGNWSLYVADDFDDDGGQIANGWCLFFELNAPVIPTMALDITSVTSTQVHLSFETDTAGNYTLETSQDLATWATLQSFTAATPGVTLLPQAHNLSEDRRFYRVTKP